MSTAALEPLPPSSPPLLLLHQPQPEAEAGTPPEDTDWLSSLSPHQRSCINLGKVEPCVNKAIQLLARLRERLEEETRRRRKAEEEEEKHRDEKKGEMPSRRGGRVSTVMWEKEEEEEEEGRKGGEKVVKPLSTDRGSLCIEGTATGTKVKTGTSTNHSRTSTGKGGATEEDEEERGWKKGIQATIDLIVRLEEDRQETMRKLEEEEERVRTLQLSLDEEAKKRMDRLESVVQAEHEACLRDVQELKWCVGYESRQLSRAEDDLRIVAGKNAQLKRDVAHLKETCPLLEGKIEDEHEKIKEIGTLQEETSEALKKARHVQMATEEKLLQTRRMVNAERREKESELNSIRNQLSVANNQLSSATSEAEQLSHKISDLHKFITEGQLKARDLEEKAGQKRLELAQVKSRVAVLHDQNARVLQENKKIDDYNVALRAELEEERRRSESALALQQEALAKAERKLRETRDKKEELEQDNDALREKIAACKKQQQDDLKSVERAKKELLQLDQQLKVSMSRYSQLRELNHELTQRLKDEEVRTGDVEYTLKNTVESLEKQLKEQTSIRADFEAKLTKVKSELRRVMKETEREEEKLQTVTRRSEDQNKDYGEKISKMEAAVKMKSEVVEQLQKELEEVRERDTKTRTELQAKMDELEEQHKQLTAELSEKNEEEKEARERERLVRDRLTEVEKSSLMMEKMQKETELDIEKLESEGADLQEQIAREKEEEESWKKEYQEISEFSADAEEKHQKYLEQRQQLLKNISADLREALLTNASLSQRYQALQSRYLQVKDRALVVMEREMEKEATLRDHKQLLALQSRMSSTMKNYYQHRSSSYTDKLVACHSQAAHSSEELRTLMTQLRTTVKAMDDFLSHELHEKPPTKKTVTFKD